MGWSLVGHEFYKTDVGVSIDRMIRDHSVPISDVVAEIERCCDYELQASRRYRENEVQLIAKPGYHPWKAWVATGNAAYLGWDPEDVRDPDGTLWRRDGTRVPDVRKAVVETLPRRRRAPAPRVILDVVLPLLVIGWFLMTMVLGPVAPWVGTILITLAGARIVWGTRARPSPEAPSRTRSR